MTNPLPQETIDRLRELEHLCNTLTGTKKDASEFLLLLQDSLPALLVAAEQWDRLRALLEQPELNAYTRCRFCGVLLATGHKPGCEWEAVMG